MPETDALAQLKDIYLPSEVTWWPLAPGWYFIALLLVLFLACLGLLSYKYHLRKRFKKQAIALLDSYTHQYAKNRNAQLTTAAISELLKRVALVYFPRERVASMHGQDWLNFLTSTSKGLDFNTVSSLLLDAPFQPNQARDLSPLIELATRWIKQRSGSCSN